MRFGVLYEIHTPRPWHERSDYERYWQCIEEIKLAEAVGFDQVWAVEHHFTEEFAHCSAPEVFLSAVAQHTTTMRIGHGVVLLPKAYNHALRVAERGAALDILSHGRLDLGTGRSATTLELRGFEIDPDDTRPMWEEAIQIIPKFWTEERASFKGRYYDIPRRTVLPHPVQKPHPPLWMAGGQQASLELAAKYGLGFLHFALLDPAESFNYVRSYKTKIRDAQPVAGFVNNQFGAFTIGYCGEDEDEVRNVGGPGALYYAGERNRVQGAWEKAYGTVPESYRHYQNQTKKLDLTSKDALPGLLNIGSMAVGTAEQCRRVVEIYDQAGADQLILYMELPYLRHEQIAKSIRLFGERVIQPYRAAHAAREASGDTARVP
ncbi:MAG TPA: LLM class flavin-dependent oxidoreductase [Dehalococcoidia bacterium]|nr:LLM class flavin-dependent oxidoreductase [Dehalococcoidia bacterium]